MHPTVCRCPNCTGRAHGSGAAVFETVLALVALASVVLARFVVGRVLFREVGPWDATYRGWAPLVPDEVTRTRGVGYPRSNWARRPGYQRQAVRLLAVLVLVGGIVAPVLTTAALGGAVLAGAGVAFALTRGRPAPDEEPFASGYGFVSTAQRTAVPPYSNPYLQTPYVQTPYRSYEQSNAQDTPMRVHATAVRMDSSHTREGRW